MLVEFATSADRPGDPERDEDPERATPSPRALGRAATASLSPRELEVLREFAHGLTNAQIATRLAISEGTVKTHVKNLLRKLGVNSRAAAIALLWS